MNVKKMKKVLFLLFLLFLIGLGTANVRAQVRIGGNEAPNTAAVLDLNANNDAIPAAKGGLALPRINLASTSAQLNGATPPDGTLVYNTNPSITGGSGEGLYYWVTDQWVKLGGGGSSETALNVTPELDENYTVKATDDIVLFTTTSGVKNATFPTTGVTVGKKIYISDKGSMGVSFNASAFRTASYTFLYAGNAATVVYIGGGKWEVFSGY